MDNASSPVRHSVIAGAIEAELDRQAQSGNSRVDVDAMAEAVEHVIDEPDADQPPAAPPSEGKRPEDLNSTNDD